MPEDFWDRIAAKIGYDHSYINKEIVGSSGEAKFKELISNSATGSKILDVGCADGVFTIDIAKRAERVVGIDNSGKMIEKAEENRKKARESNVLFAVMDANKMSFEDESFDVVFSRRGPATSSPESLKECYRVLKKGGVFIEITIGEKDCRELGDIFGRCQTLKIEHPVSSTKSSMLKNVGFDDVNAEDFIYKERLATMEDMIMLLETTPIIQDFDREKDRNSTEKLRRLLGSENIVIGRHRVMLIGKKSNFI